jgi:hypothetical protein
MPGTSPGHDVAGVVGPSQKNPGHRVFNDCYELRTLASDLLVARSAVRNSLDSPDHAARITESFRRRNIGAVLIEVCPALDVAWRTGRNTIGFAGGVVGRQSVFCSLAAGQQNRDQSQNSKNTHIRLPHSLRIQAQPKVEGKGLLPWLQNSCVLDLCREIRQRRIDHLAPRCGFSLRRGSRPTESGGGSVSIVSGLGREQGPDESCHAREHERERR